MLVYIILIMNIICIIAIIIVSYEVWINSRGGNNPGGSIKESFGSTAASWIANPVLMSDVRGNITKDAPKGSSVLQTYIDSSIKNAVDEVSKQTLDEVSKQITKSHADLEGQISSLDKIVKENADAASQRFDDLNNNAIMKYQNISLVRVKDPHSVMLGDNAKNIQDITDKQWHAGWGTTNLPRGVPNVPEGDFIGALHDGGDGKSYTNWGGGSFNFMIAPPYRCNQYGHTCHSYPSWPPYP